VVEILNAEIKTRIEMINKGEVPEGYKKTKEWKKYKFDDIAILSNKKYYPKDDVRNYRCIELEHIEQETGRINGWSNSTEQKSAKTYFKSGDILYGKLRPYLRKYYLAEFNGVCSTEIWVINSKTNFVDNGYLFYLIQTKKFNNAANISTGTRMPRADWKYIKNTIFKIPPLPEQQKIAQILSTWDEAIELKEKLIEEKKQQKKGLMQKLLTGEIRLPGFDGEWEEVRLGDVAECLDNKRIPLNSAEREKMKGDIPYYGANGIVDYINDYIFDEKLILLAEDGGNFDEFSTKPIAIRVKGKSWVNNHAHILRPLNIDYDYLFYELVHKDIRKYINGTTRSKLTRGEMIKILILAPKNIKEQKAIAQILSTADKEIDLLTQELEQLKLQKKGLMQLLLTGIIRVKS
jgi:type I restriction enzyme S subunit